MSFYTMPTTNCELKAWDNECEMNTQDREFQKYENKEHLQRT